MPFSSKCQDQQVECHYHWLFTNTLHIATVTIFSTKGWGSPSDVVSFTTMIPTVCQPTHLLKVMHSFNHHSGDMTTSVGIDVTTNVAVSGVPTGDVAAIMLGVLYTVTILGVIASVPILWLYCRIRKQKKIIERAMPSFNTSGSS